MSAISVICHQRDLACQEDNKQNKMIRKHVVMGFLLLCLQLLALIPQANGQKDPLPACTRLDSLTDLYYNIPSWFSSKNESRKVVKHFKFDDVLPDEIEFFEHLSLVLYGPPLQRGNICHKCMVAIGFSDPAKTSYSFVLFDLEKAPRTHVRVGARYPYVINKRSLGEDNNVTTDSAVYYKFKVNSISDLKANGTVFSITESGDHVQMVSIGDPNQRGFYSYERNYLYDMTHISISPFVRLFDLGGSLSDSSVRSLVMLRFDSEEVHIDGSDLQFLTSASTITVHNWSYSNMKQQNVGSAPNPCNNLNGYFYRRRYFLRRESFVNLIAIESVEVTFGLIVFLLQVLLRNKYLVKAKGAVAIACCVSILLNELCDLLVDIGSLPLLNRHFILFRLLLVFVGNLSIYIGFTMYILQVVRYFLVRNIYHIIGAKKGQADIKRVKMYRRLISKRAFGISTLVISIAGFLLLCALFLALPAEMAFHAITGFQYAINISHGIVGVVVSLADAAAHWHEIKEKGIRWYLFFDDPLFFRVEMLWIVVTMISGAIMIFTNIVLPDYWIVRVPENFPKFYAMVWLTVPFSWLMQSALQLSVGGGISTFIELYWLITGHNHYELHQHVAQFTDLSEDLDINSRNSAVEAFLRDSKAYELMDTFTKVEFSSENLMLWTELHKWKKAGAVLVGDFLKVFDMYIASGSLYETNISSSTRKKLTSLAAEVKGNRGSAWNLISKIEFCHFECAYQDVLQNLTDSFTRLTKSSEYKVFIKQRTLEIELLRKKFSVQ